MLIVWIVVAVVAFLVSPYYGLIVIGAWLLLVAFTLVCIVAAKMGY